MYNYILHLELPDGDLHVFEEIKAEEHFERHISVDILRGKLVSRICRWNFLNRKVRIQVPYKFCRTN
jgi:hypothetical protein